MEDSLQSMPLEKWLHIETILKSDFPRSICGYTVLKTQRHWILSGFNYGFKVFCPYGDPRYGIVAINRKDQLCQIIIQCPTNDTSKLRDALLSTREINWNEMLEFPFSPTHVVQCIRSILHEFSLEMIDYTPNFKFVLEKNSPMYENISLPSNLHFDNLSLKHVELVDSKWPHRYPSSDWYFNLLIKAKQGFGLFEGSNLICWVFVNEMGNLGHLFTLEDFRCNGYAEMLLKLVSNMLRQEGKDVIVFCIKRNENACKLYRTLGFKEMDDVAWCTVQKKVNV